MPDVTLNSNNYASYDFSQTQLVSQEKFESLLEAEGRMSDRVRFTLDEKHQLTAFKLPKNKDNAFVAFFKRIFSASYRRQEKLLENYEKLSQNATFNQKVTQEILDKLSNLGERANFISQRIKASIGRNPDFEITPKIICDEKFNSGMAITTVKHASLKKIVYQGELLSAKEFIAKFQGLECAGDGKITQGFLNKFLEGNKEALGAYLSQEAQDEIELLFSQDKLEHREALRLKNLISSATLAFLQDVGSYINGALHKGEDPATVARNAKEIIDKACDETVDFSNFMDEESGRIALLSDLDDTSAVFNKDSLEGSRKENFERLKDTFPNYKDEQIFIFLNLIEERHMKINTFLAFHENFQHFKQELIALSQLSNEAPSEVIDSSAQDTPETKELKAFINLVKSYEEALQDPNKRGSQAGREDINKITSFIAYELGVEKAISPKGLDFLDKTLHILAAFNDPEVDPYGEDHKRNFYFTSQQRSFVTGLENTLGFLTPYVIEAENKSLDPKVKADFTKLCESFVLEKISEFTSLDDYARFDVNAFLNERMDSALASVQNPSQRKENTSPQTQGRV